MDELDGVVDEDDSVSLLDEVTEAHLRHPLAREVFDRCHMRIAVGPGRWRIPRPVAETIKACGQ
ncbi:MAG: hypothetical protein WC052_00790 [Patescibacteria group bacterium]|jgi:hypothetical protein